LTRRQCPPRRTIKKKKNRGGFKRGKRDGNKKRIDEMNLNEGGEKERNYTLLGRRKKKM